MTEESVRFGDDVVAVCKASASACSTKNRAPYTLKPKNFNEQTPHRRWHLRLQMNSTLNQNPEQFSLNSETQV